MQITFAEPINYVDRSEEINAAIENIEIALSDIVNIVRYKRSVIGCESFSEEAKGYLKETLESYYTKYEFEIPGGNISMESLESPKIALEGFGDIISKIWEAIKNTFKAIWEYITNSFDMTAKKAADNEVKVSKNKETVDNIKKDANHKMPNAFPLISDTSILEGFGKASGEIKANNLENRMKSLIDLFYKAEKVLDGVDKDSTAIQNFSADVAGAMTSKDNVEALSKVMEHSLKLQTTEVISHEFNPESKTPDSVLRVAGLSAVDTKMTRSTNALSHGFKLYFVKPMEKHSFYRCIADHQLPDKPMCSIRYFKFEELERLVDVAAKNGGITEDMVRKLKEKIAAIKQDQTKQIEVVDKLIKALPDLADAGVDETSVKKLLEPVLTLTKQSVILTRDSLRLVDRIVSSDKFYNGLLLTMLKYIEKPEEENKK